GYFDDSIPELEGKYFKTPRDDKGKEGVWDTDKWVIEQLKEMDKLLDTREYTHDYPFCWRCHRALLYYARESWFIEMSRYRYELLENNDKVNWVPNTIGEGRFGNFLDNVRDWSLSRERFWGTPLPIWECTNENCKHLLAVGSYKELKKLSRGNVDLEDYHKPMIDEVIIPCPKCESDMQRIPEVIDCWYDSGSAPFAQYHYPFENKELVEEQGAYPVDIIAEGMDQTRGWFYTLHAIATVVFGQNAFNNVVVNGIVLDGEGQKMSKSVGNTIDPWTIFHKYGSDPLRWYYYVSGPPYKEKRLSKEKVRYVVSQFIRKYWNSYLLFSKNARRLEVTPSLDFDPSELDNYLDKWAIAKINDLAINVKKLLDDYLIYESSQLIQDFVINDLSNWYLRLVRDRFLEEDADTYNVVFYIFNILNRLLAPYIPFVSEKIFLELQKTFDYEQDLKSIHLADYPEGDSDLVDESLLEEMKFLVNFVQELRALRDKVRIKTRQPIREYLFNLDEEKKVIINKFDHLIKSELNVKELNFVSKDKIKSFYGEEIVLDKGEIGKTFKQDRLKVEDYLRSLEVEELREKISKGNFTTEIEGKEFKIKKDYFDIEQEAKEGYAVNILSYGTLVINGNLDEELLKEGFAREFIRNIQSIRKKLQLSRFKEKIIINLFSDSGVKEKLGDFLEDIKEETGCVEIKEQEKGKEFSFKIQGEEIKIGVEVIEA
ncbi:MAG: class I tRNA ligase family protein, partial [Promethearchaeia archaeon]